MNYFLKPVRPPELGPAFQQGLGFRGLGFGVEGFRVLRLGFTGVGLGFRDLDARIHMLKAKKLAAQKRRVKLLKKTKPLP